MWSGGSQIPLLCAFLLTLNRDRGRVLANDKRMSLYPVGKHLLPLSTSRAGTKSHLLQLNNCHCPSNRYVASVSRQVTDRLTKIIFFNEKVLKSVSFRHLWWAAVLQTGSFLLAAGGCFSELDEDAPSCRLSTASPSAISHVKETSRLLCRYFSVLFFHKNVGSVRAQITFLPKAARQLLCSLSAPLL